jgi:hypothetical protein
MPLKPISHGIKLWCLADSHSKYVFNLEIYVGADNEKIAGLEKHKCGKGAGVVTRLT